MDYANAVVIPSLPESHMRLAHGATVQLCSANTQDAQGNGKRNMMKLTLTDLENAKRSDLRGGTVGYSEGDWLSTTMRQKGDRIVLRRANAQGWTMEHLVGWVDSKYGRWFWDSLYGCRDATGAARLVTLDWMDADDRALYGIPS